MASPVKEQRISDLLSYLPDYGVLLCRSCQFAVQPSAFSSHLLRHQIYRNERRHLIERLRTFTIVEPEEVNVPPPTSAPITGLPVYRGLACAAPECSHCCVSDKRMAKHWSVVHNKPNAQDIRAKPAILQTFFRGNKNRYFEVTAISDMDLPIGFGMASDDASSPASSSSEFRNILRDLRSPTAAPKRSKSIGAESKTEDDNTKPRELDMLSLKLLHHWYTTACTTMNRGTEAVSFFHHDILQEAFRHEFLMHGILAVSASHLLRFTTDPTSRLELHQASLHHISEGVTEFRKVLSNEPTTENATATITFTRLLGIQRCAEAQSQIPDNTAAEDESLDQLLELFFLLRGCVQLLVKCQTQLPSGSHYKLPQHVLDGLEAATPRQRMELDQLSWQDSLVLPPRSWFPNLSPDMYEQLVSLPLKLTLFAPSTDPKEMETFEDAALSLLNSFNRSYESEEPWALWDGVESWANGVPDALTGEFVSLVKAKNPRILVMCAQWCLLIRRLEEHYWFMEGHSERLLKSIIANLEGEPRQMVIDLMG